MILPERARQPADEAVDWVGPDSGSADANIAGSSELERGSHHTGRRHRPRSRGRNPNEIRETEDPA